jgi:hypothetical protein
MSGANEGIKIPVSNDKSGFLLSELKTTPGVNEVAIENIKNGMNDFFKLDPNLYGEITREKKVVDLPWTDIPLSIGDFIQWVIRVNFNGIWYDEQINISVIDFKDRFLKHPLHYEYVFFDIDNDSDDDVQVFYSFYTSTIHNNDQGFEVKSLESMLKVRTEGINTEDRYGELQVWSEIKLNYGLIKETNRVRSFSSRLTTFFGKFIEKFGIACEKLGLTRIANLLKEKIQNNNYNVQPTYEPVNADDDHVAVGIGFGSPLNEKIPLYMEKRFGVAKENIFKPMVFEHELKQVGAKEPLEMLFGFQSYRGTGTGNKQLDLAFGVEFDPAIYIRAQYIPIGGYVYYNFGGTSAHTGDTKLTFVADINQQPSDYGAEGTEFSVIFDETNAVAQSGKWISFDINLRGFEYRASHRFDIGCIVDSPLFGGFTEKISVKGMPLHAELEWDFVDFDVTIVQDELVEVDFESWIGLTIGDSGQKISEVTVNYPTLRDDIDVAFLKINNIPSQKVTGRAHFKLTNGTFLNMNAWGEVNLDSDGNIAILDVFYPKADPNNEDMLLLSIPSGIPNGKIKAEAEINVDIDDFSNQGNYIYGKASRELGSNFDEINFFLPNQDLPIVRIYEIPSNAYIKGNFEWNKIKGYGEAKRWTPGPKDPVELNLEFGSLLLKNVLKILDGEVLLDFHLAEDGYIIADATNEMFENSFTASNSASGNGIILNSGTLSADDFYLDWNLDTTGSQIQIEELALTGKLNSFENFYVEMGLDGDYLDFEGSWVQGNEASFEIDFYQTDPIILSFQLSDYIPDFPFDVFGSVTLSNNLHFDISWNWDQGLSLEDPGYFYINKDNNQPNIQTFQLDFTYTPDGYNDPQYGVYITLSGLSIYFSLKWWKHPDGWWPSTWLEYSVSGSLDVDLLWEGSVYNIL